MTIMLFLVNSTIVWVFLLCMHASPMICTTKDTYFHLTLKRKKITNFQQALANLYAHKPHLLQQQLPESTESYTIYSWEKIFTYSIDIIPLLYFCYGSYNNYMDYVSALSQESYIHQKILSYFPSLFVNTPEHIGLFLQETELLLKTYLLKLFLKMVVFCFR